MNFDIYKSPPSEDELYQERCSIIDETRRIRNRDTVISFIIIVIASLLLGSVTLSATDSLRYAAITFSVMPLIGVILGISGLISVFGFRSNAQRVIELRNTLVSLSPVREESHLDIYHLCSQYAEVDAYCRNVVDSERSLVNGELAMFWDWDASTQAKFDRQKARLDRSRLSLPASPTAA